MGIFSKNRNLEKETHLFAFLGKSLTMWELVRNGRISQKKTSPSPLHPQDPLSFLITF